MHHTTARCNHVTYYVVMLLKNATVHYLECSAKWPDEFVKLWQLLYLSFIVIYYVDQEYRQES